MDGDRTLQHGCLPSLSQIKSEFSIWFLRSKFIPEGETLSPSMDSTSQEQKRQVFASVPARPPNLDKQWISMENAKRFSCDASLLTVLEDKDGNVLNVGRKTRTIPTALVRALDVRDETCQFPGCCESHYVDFHHVKHWANFGETKMDNLIKLCRFHHRALHAGLYNIEAKGKKQNLQFILRNAAGKVMEQNPRLPQSDKTTVDGAIKDFELQWPYINARTGSSL